MTTEYPFAIASLLAIAHPMPLDAGPSNRDAADRLRSISLEQLFEPHAIRNRPAARACLAGLWLRFGWLDESHTVSQSLDTTEGAFWHAIMHRREPDAWNSKYWWRRVGSHRVHDRLRECAPSVGYSYTTPEAFVDYCERVRDSGTPDEEIACRVQHLEWQLLFDDCYQRAIG